MTGRLLLTSGAFLVTAWGLFLLAMASIWIDTGRRDILMFYGILFLPLSCSPPGFLSRASER